MALALSGALLQGITRNELADPGIIGINAGAGVAVAIFFLYFPAEVGSFIYMLPFVAFLGALLTAVIIYVFSYSRTTGMQPVRLVLVGVDLSMALSGLMIVMISSAVALAASAVSVTGGISFIGLMAPHIARSLIGPRHQLFLPISILIGGWLLLLADTIGRNIVEPNGLPAGVMVALIGAPYFIYLLTKK